MIAVPECMAGFLENAGVERMPSGFSGSEIYIIRPNDGKNDGNFYLKHMPDDMFGALRREAEVMRWLRGVLPVPEAVCFRSENSAGWLLTAEIPGESFARALDAEPRALVRTYAGALRRVHEVSPDGCPFDESNAVKTRNALKRCEAGLVKPEYFREDRQKLGVAGIKELLLRTPPPEEDFVFTHGDYCFPNVIRNNGQLSGYVDLSAAGAADRYQDAAIGARSVYFNMRRVRGLGAESARELADCFLRDYGLNRPDMQKMEYYQLLDDFFR